MQMDRGGALPIANRVNLFHCYTYTIIHSQPSILPRTQGSSADTHTETDDDDLGTFLCWSDWVSSLRGGGGDFREGLKNTISVQ